MSEPTMSGVQRQLTALARDCRKRGREIGTSDPRESHVWLYIASEIEDATNAVIRAAQAYRSDSE